MPGQPTKEDTRRIGGYCRTPMTWLQLKSQGLPKFDEKEKHPGLSSIYGGCVKCYNHFGTLYSSFL